MQLNPVELDADVDPAVVLDAKTVATAVVVNVVVVGELETGAVVCASDKNVALSHRNAPPLAQHDVTFSAVPQHMYLSLQGEMATWSPTATREDIICQWSHQGLSLMIHRLIVPLVHCEAQPESLLKLWSVQAPLYMLPKYSE